MFDIKIHYSTTENDYIRFNIYHYTHSPSIKRTRQLLRFVFPLPFVLLFAHTSTGWPFNTVVQAIIFYVAFVLIFSLLDLVHTNYMMRRTIRKMMKEGCHNEFIGDFSMELADNVLRETGSGHILEVAYDRIDRIAHDGNLSYIYIGAVTASILPDNTFGDDIEKSTFFDALRERMTKQRNIADSLAMPDVADIEFEPPRAMIETRSTDLS